MRAHLVLACSILSTASLAADALTEPPLVRHAPVRPSPVPHVPVPHVVPLSWTGGHVGLSGSVATGMSDWTFRPSASPNLGRESRAGGATYGVEAGFDIELDRLVVGAVAGIRRARGYSSIRMPNGHRPAGGSDRIGLSQDWEASLRGRIGARFDDTLAYVHGGVTVEKARLRAAGRETILDTSYGAVGGVGVEHRLGPRLSLVSEYAYRPGSDIDAEVHGVPLSVKRRLHELKTGVRLRF